jgi:hypothetical protein
MDKSTKEILTILLTAIILGASVSYMTNQAYLTSIVAFFAILVANIIVKKLISYHYESDITIKPWSIYQFGFRKDAHFKEPVPMSWVPILLTLLTNGAIWWLAILQFDVKARPERVSKRHGLYRFTEMTEWHIGMIAFSGILTNLIIGIVSYTLGFEFFAKLNIYYAAWSLAPLGNLDGTKLFFANKSIWIITAIVTAIVTIIIAQV